ncbi:MAG TPA: T9SS type A sorting domain-containing protein [Brumimicrobium sp.]|nr:T9SS type A sorting domain-containing protein [Brumimicrobium sp.]
MKLLLLFFSFCLALVSQSQTGTQTTNTMTHDGKVREYILYVPQMYDVSVEVPLVINLHGYTSNMTQQLVYGDFRKIADTANFILVVPNGLTDGTGNQHWNFFQPNGEDDLGFLSALIDELTSNYAVNTNRVYSTGMSNGGYMSIHLACNLSSKITAVASVTGTMNPFAMSSCSPSRPVPTMLIHGTNDPTVPYNGNTTSASVPNVISHWVNQTNCNTTPILTNVPNTSTTDGCTAEHYLYTGGTNGATVELFKIIDGGHTWPGAPVNIGVTNQDINASKEIWRFFSQFSTSDLVSLQEEFIDFVTLYPNPSKGNIKISPKQSIERILVLSAEGKVVRSIENITQEITIENLVSGIYFVQIQTKEKSFSKKMIVN